MHENGHSKTYESTRIVSNYKCYPARLPIDKLWEMK